MKDIKSKTTSVCAECKKRPKGVVTWYLKLKRMICEDCLRNYEN